MRRCVEVFFFPSFGGCCLRREEGREEGPRLGGEGEGKGVERKREREATGR